ncbi:conserved Plasmodium protein, unknown function [Plasmodium yoelii]|uniref:Uncharacterized protein n=2 Tax=Plasmodium yoelii TaxID=5861 RepID=A0AAE9WUH3_PLAYO|nr:conserved Plasmodium protein, unknown function [Plasmodium yoelii]WBY60367.1 hypothetical protein Py17XNL_001303465 [Plasmodium yoelii yoelii]CDU20243.1 conserved Plasmodium protein, unknown function [Plasmodium yoelii]VTZ81001.1 conserved Plasmodium protein, unknown function [Plasmodium yoelii]|eukprot:XP_022813741.1 conserved Plasmodium protein, unknown function [Plasmodium yoelii]
MFIASYFDRKDTLQIKKEEKNEDECRRNNIERVLKNAIISYKEKKNNNKIKDTENTKEEIKQVLSNFLKKQLKKRSKKNIYFGKKSCDDQNGINETYRKVLFNQIGFNDYGNNTDENKTVNIFLKNNKYLKYCSGNILLLGQYLNSDKLKDINIENIYKNVDIYIGDSKSQISKIKTQLEMEAEREIKIENDNLHKIYYIKKELKNNQIVEESNNTNIIEHMIKEIKIIKNLKKQKEYLISIKNTLSNLEKAKKFAVNRNYDNSLYLILDVVKKIHIFKTNTKRVIIKDIQFIITLISQYYFNKIKLLLSSIQWGNNISHVSIDALEEIINNMDGLIENQIDKEIVVSDNRKEDTKYNTEIDPMNNILNLDTLSDNLSIMPSMYNNNTDDKSAHLLEEKLKKKKKKTFIDSIDSSTIFNDAYISLIKKESFEFVNIIFSWHLIEKIQTYINRQNGNKKSSSSNSDSNDNEDAQSDHPTMPFSFEKCECSMSYVDKMAEIIIQFFRSFFQNHESPLFKFDKPEWGLKYLFYQSIISSYIFKMLINYDNLMDLNKNVIFHYALQDFFMHKKFNENHKNGNNTFETIEQNCDKTYKHDHMDIHKNRDENNKYNVNTFIDTQNNSNEAGVEKYYMMYNNMTNEEKRNIYYEIINYDKAMKKLNYKIIADCRLYILSRISYFINMYYLNEKYKDDIKKSFFNFIHHIIMIYNKWFVYDNYNCKYLLEDFFTNTYVELLNIESVNNSFDNNSDSINLTHNLKKVGTSVKDENGVEGNEDNKYNYSDDDISIKNMNKNKKHNSSESIKIRGICVRDFFILIEKEFLSNILNDMSENNCCIKLKNNIILEENDCINEYGDIFIELLKNITKRLLHFENNNEFMEDYINNVLKNILIIVKDEFRKHWNNINDLVSECTTTCLLYVSIYSINTYLFNFKYKKYIKEMISSFVSLQNKMLSNFLDAFYHFISIRIYNLFTVHNIFHEYILNNLYKIKKIVFDHIFLEITNKVLHKLDQSIINFLIDQGVTFLHNQDTFNIFLGNSHIILQQIDELSRTTENITKFSESNTLLYSMPYLHELIKLFTCDTDVLKNKINHVKNKKIPLSNKNNWINQVTKLTNSLLSDNYNYDDVSDVFISPENRSKDFQIPLNKIKLILQRRPDIQIIAKSSIIIQEFLEQ